jgi:hypothetical protein
MAGIALLLKRGSGAITSSSKCRMVGAVTMSFCFPSAPLAPLVPMVAPKSGWETAENWV